MDIPDIAPEILKANRSFRGKGAVGKNAIIPKLVAEMFPKEIHILDYGCGPSRIHSTRLKENGFNFVHEFDFGRNWREGMVYEVKEGKYDLIYASNVANTWSTFEMIDSALVQIKNGLKDVGVLLLNYPESPRYMPDMKSYDFHNKLLAYFKEVRELQKNVWYCKK